MIDHGWLLIEIGLKLVGGWIGSVGCKYFVSCFLFHFFYFSLKLLSVCGCTLIVSSLVYASDSFSLLLSGWGCLMIVVS